MRRSSRGTTAVALVGIGLSTALVLSACGNGQALPGGTGVTGEPAPASSTPLHTDPGQLWPDAARTVVVTPEGQRPTFPAPGEFELQDLTTLAEQEGVSVEAVVRQQQDVTAFHDWVASAVRPVLGDRFSEARPAMEGEPAWVGFTGDVPPELVAAAEASYLPMELRGGALLTEAEADAVRSVGTDVFAAAAPKGFSWSAHMDTPTATYVFSGYPAEEWQPDDALLGRVVSEASRVLGRDAPFSVDLEPDDRDPLTTEPATWFLPAGCVADPRATSIEVLVEAQGCTSGEGAAGRLADPVVELTPTEVRIATPVYISKGPQTCPGHPMTPLTVELGEPLGDRTLVDVNGTIDDELWSSGQGLLTPSAG